MTENESSNGINQLHRTQHFIVFKCLDKIDGSFSSTLDREQLHLKRQFSTKRRVN